MPVRRRTLSAQRARRGKPRTKKRRALVPRGGKPTRRKRRALVRR